MPIDCLFAMAFWPFSPSRPSLIVKDDTKIGTFAEHINTQSHCACAKEEHIKLLWCGANSANNNEIKSEENAKRITANEPVRGGCNWNECELFRSFIQFFFNSVRLSLTQWLLFVRYTAGYLLCTLLLSLVLLSHFDNIKYVCLCQPFHSNCVQSFESNQIQLNIELKWDKMVLNATTSLRCSNKVSLCRCMWKWAPNAHGNRW